MEFLEDNGCGCGLAAVVVVALLVSPLGDYLGSLGEYLPWTEHSEVLEARQEFTARYTPELAEAMASFTTEIAKREAFLTEYASDLSATGRETANDDTYRRWSTEIASLRRMKVQLERQRDDLYLDYKRQQLEPDAETRKLLESKLKQARVLAKEKMKALGALSSSMSGAPSAEAPEDGDTDTP